MDKLPETFYIEPPFPCLRGAHEIQRLMFCDFVRSLP